MIAPAQHLIIPQIWKDAIIKSYQQRLAMPDPFAEAMAAWEQEHERRMVEDPEYAKAHEEFEREWMRIGQEEE